MKFFLPVLISFVGLLLGAFFIYKGIDKHFLSPCITFGPDSTLPANYRNAMTALCSSGFTKIIGFLEIAAGLLLIVPRTRLAGIFIIMPIIIAIFLFHLLLDNRSAELFETGIPMAITLLVFIYHQKDWKVIIAR